MFPLALVNLSRDRRRRVVDPVMSYQRPSRREYYNAPTMAWWERAYLPEIVRGLSITGGVFMRNMWRWMTFRKGALTTYYPEERRRRLLPDQPRQARADAAARRPAAMHRVQPVRNGVPREGDRDRGRVRSRRYRASQVPGALRDRLLALRVLRHVRRGVPRGCDPHGARSAELPRRRPPPHVAVAARAPDVESAEGSSRSPIHRRRRNADDRDRPPLPLRRHRAGRLARDARRPPSDARRDRAHHDDDRRWPASTRCSACT